jgi:hypothetical protein
MKYSILLAIGLIVLIAGPGASIYNRHIVNCPDLLLCVLLGIAASSEDDVRYKIHMMWCRVE